MKFLNTITCVLSITLTLTSTAAAYQKASCADPSLCCIIEVIDEECDQTRLPEDFSWAYQHTANRLCISNITSLGAAMSVKCSPGVNYIKIYDNVDCLGPPNGHLNKPGSACFYPNKWFIRSFVVGSSLIGLD